jgi:hypothetical protein
MIPKGRFDEALSQRDRAAQEAAYWRGRAEANGQSGTPQGGSPGAPQPQQPTADQRLAAIQTQQDALAVKFDNGEITYSDLVREQRTLTNQEQAIREEILLAKVRPAESQAKPGGDDLYLQTATDQIEQAHPWCGVFNELGAAADAAWNFVAAQATDNLIARGIDPTAGPRGRLELRKEAAQLADKLGPTLIGVMAKAKGIAVPGQQPTPQGTQPPKAPLSPIAQARQAKLATAANAPPNLNAMNGSNGDPSGLPSEAAIEAMGEDAIGDMPEAQRRRLLGLT